MVRISHRPIPPGSVPAQPKVSSNSFEFDQRFRGDRLTPGNSRPTTVSYYFIEQLSTPVEKQYLLLALVVSVVVEPYLCQNLPAAIYGVGLGCFVSNIIDTRKHMSKKQIMVCSLWSVLWPVLSFFSIAKRLVVR